MRIATGLTGAALVTLFSDPVAGMAAAWRPPEAPSPRRAYYRVESPAARDRVAPHVTREFPGGIVCATAQPQVLEALAVSPGLTFVGFEGKYRPEPIAAEEVGTREAPPGAAADPVRPCYLPGWIPPVHWGIKAIYDDAALARPSGGAGVRIGVIDTGVAPHLDVVGRLVKCMDMTESQSLPPCADSMGHGTLIASIIAADGGFDGRGMFGVAPEASIYSYRVCDPSRECFGSYVAAAIHQAIADGVHIINLSLVGQGYDEVVRAAVDSAQAHNVLVVAAAGNSPPFSYVGWPAVHREVVSVAAITESRAPWQYSAAGANDRDYVREEEELEVAAPGSPVLAAMKGGCWVLAHGTSLAAPHITGLAAKLWNGDAIATRGRLQGAARLFDLHTAGDDGLTGFGLPTLRQGPVVVAMATGGGTLSPAGVVPLAPGASRTFTIAPLTNCYRIQDVKVDGVSVGPVTSYTFNNVTSIRTLEAVFTQLTYAMDASAGPGGLISPAGVARVPCASTAVYTISPSDICHRIRNVVVDGVTRGPITSFSFTNVRADHTIGATFTKLGPYAFFAGAGTGGTISPSGASSVPCGANLTYAIAPAASCAQVLNVVVDGVSRGPLVSYTFLNVTAGHSIQAEFSAGGPYNITASAGPGGAITPSGTTSVTCGDSRNYTITPAGSGYAIRDVIVDGVSQGPIFNYTFTGVSNGHTIQATFVARGRSPRPTDAAPDAGPAEPALSRPVPNPSRGSVQVRYGIPVAGAVRLSVVDVQGREVAVLSAGTQPAGWAWATWNGEIRGGRAPGGVYFFRLEHGGRQYVQRFALVR